MPLLNRCTGSVPPLSISRIGHKPYMVIVAYFVLKKRSLLHHGIFISTHMSHQKQATYLLVLVNREALT